MARDIKAEENIYVSVERLHRLQYQAKGFSLLPHQPAKSILAGKNVSKLRGRGLNFEELRHYRPGDDIRAMDWKTTRRVGKPHIKVYTEERERNVYLVIDQRNCMFFGSKKKMKSVVAAELCALLAWQVTHSGDRVGAVIYNDTDIRVLPARRGRQHVTRVLSEVVRMNHLLAATECRVPVKESVNMAMRKVANVVANNSMVILVGDSHGWDGSATNAIKRIRQHSEVIACNVMDPLEKEIPKMPHMVVSDGALQIQFSSDDEAIQARYRVDINSQLDSYDRMAKKYRIPFLSVDTLIPIEQQLRKALGARFI